MLECAVKLCAHDLHHVPYSRGFHLCMFLKFESSHVTHSGWMGSGRSSREPGTQEAAREGCSSLHISPVRKTPIGVFRGRFCARHWARVGSGTHSK